MYYFCAILVAMQSPHEASSAISVSLDVGAQQSGPYVVDHDDSTQQGSGIFGWFSNSNFMNKVVEKTKVRFHIYLGQYLHLVNANLIWYIFSRDLLCDTLEKTKKDLDE